MNLLWMGLGILVVAAATEPDRDPGILGRELDIISDRTSEVGPWWPTEEDE